MPVTWANTLGFFRVAVDRSKCTECGVCEKVCDFGLPIRALSKKNPVIKTNLCMGCGRCRDLCPQSAIRFLDVRDFVRDRGFRKARESSQKIEPRMNTDKHGCEEDAG